MPEGLAGIPAWVFWLVGAGGLTALVSAILVFVATRKRDQSTDLSSRWDDASELSQKMREAIEKEVERQVAPIRTELEKVKAESHEIQNAFREWIIGVWKWGQRGRLGDMPMPPPQILHRLGLGYLADDEWHTEPTRFKETP